MPSGVKAILSPSGASEPADPAVRRIERGERDAGDRRRQREGQVDRRVEELAAGKAVARQHPGDEQAEDANRRAPPRRRARRRRASAAVTRGSRARRPEPASPTDEARRIERRERDQDDQPEIGDAYSRTRDRSPAARSGAGSATRCAAALRGATQRGGRHASAIRLQDRVEDAAIVEMGLLRLGPAAEDLVDGEELQLRQALEILLRGGLRLGAADSSAWR